MSVLTTVWIAFAHAAVAAPVSLFYLDKTHDGCTAKIRVLPTGVERVLFTSKVCPTNILFDGPQVVTVEAGRIRSHSLTDGKTTEIGRLPVPEVAALWLEESGTMRAIWLASNVTVANGKMQFEGKEYAVPADLPDWGLPAMAILAEFKDQKWTRIMTKPTMAYAGDTPGTGVLGEPWNPKKTVVALANLQAGMTCEGRPKLDCNAAEDATVQTLVGPSDSLGVIEIDGNTSLAFPVAFGDTAHAVAPLFLCHEGCKTSTLIEKKPVDAYAERQLGLAVEDGFILVVDEYSGENGRVIDVSGKTIFALPKTSSAAVFLPTSVAH